MRETDGMMEALPGGVLGVLADREPVKLLHFSENKLIIQASYPFMERHPMFHLSFYALDRRTDQYEILSLSEAKEISRKRRKDAVELCFQVDDLAYVRLVRHSTAQMAAYIRDRMESDSGYFLPTGEEPPSESEQFSSNALTWFSARRTPNVQAFLHAAQADHEVETALVFDRPEYAEAFLSGSVDVSGYDRLYLGNSWCSRLYPEASMLSALLKKASEHNKKITVCFAPVTEGELEKTAKKITFLSQWCLEYKENIEVVVNDWGTFSMIESPFLEPVCGTLLNRRRKDPRLKFAAGTKEHEEELRFGTVNEPAAAHLLKRLGVTRIEYEGCGLAVPAREFSASLTLPLYETALSLTCALAAVCLEGDRGKQHSNCDCKEVCRNTCLLYPEETDLIGIGNVIWGFDRELTEGIGALTRIKKAGFGRLVWNMPVLDFEETESIWN